MGAPLEAMRHGDDERYRALECNEEGAPMTFGFLLTVVTTHSEGLSSDETEAEIDLAVPIRHVTLRPRPRGAGFSGAQELDFIGHRYDTAEEAEEAGEALKNVIRLAAVDVGKAVDVGDEVTRSRFGPVVVEEAAKRGLLLLPDVHGLQVFEETGIPVVVSTRAELSAPAPLPSFIDALGARAPQAADVSAKHALACDLFARSRFESSQKSRHLTLVTALEVLSDRQARSGRAAQLVEEFQQAIKDAREQADPTEVKQLESLASAANDLRSESISAAIHRLAASSSSTGLKDNADLDELVRRSYRARSSLVHDGSTNQDLIALLGPLQELVRSLCATAPKTTH
jgi:hypothetical protein